MQGAIEAANRRFVGVKRIVRQYREAPELIGKITDEGAASNIAVEKDGLGAAHLDKALLFESEKQTALLLIEDAAVHTKETETTKRTAALDNLLAFYSYAALLPEKLRKVHKKTFPASKSTSEKFLRLRCTG